MNIDKMKHNSIIRMNGEEVNFDSILFLKEIIKNPRYENNYNTDFENREFAFLGLNGIIFEGATHKDILQNYIGDEEETELYYDYGSIIQEEQEELGEPMFSGSMIKNDDKQIAVLYPHSIFDYTIKESIESIKCMYPDATICLDITGYDTCDFGDNPFVLKVS